MSYISNREDFLIGLVQEFPDQVDQVVKIGRALLQAAQSYYKLQVRACNRGLTDAERSRERQLELLIERQVHVLDKAGTVSIGVEFAGDPRGYVVKLRLPSGRSNSFGGEGVWGVPTRK